MNNQKDPLHAEDNLHAENNLLKLKLGVEYGMHMEDLSELSPALQNEWLKSVYAFEQSFKNGKRVKVYDYIGRPTFCKWDTLTSDQTRTELQRLELIMENNSVELDCICKYDDAVIYRFITEELFQHEMDDMRVTGMTYHFTYEEFHPNHDYDLRDYSRRYVEAIMTRPWDEEYDGMHLAASVLFSGHEHDRRSISSIIRTFQEAHGVLTIERMHITQVSIDTNVTKADVNANLCVTGKMRDGHNIRYEGNCALHFTRSDDYWFIGDFHIPGFSEKE